MAKKELIELTAVALIAEGVIGVLYPEKYTQLWAIGPKPMRHLMRGISAHPSWLRLAYAAEAAVGVWLARHEIASQ